MTMSVLEFMFAAGPSQLVLAAVAASGGWRGAGSLRDRLAAPLVATTLGLFLVLVTTDLIGVNRGEVIRLWIFLACFFQIPAAWICARLEHPYAIILVAGSSIILAALGTHTIGFIIP